MKNKIILRVKTEMKASATEEGVVEAYVSIFNNVDLGGDIMMPGAFLESLAKKLPVGVWSHNWDEPIAKTLEAREDAKGLYIKGKLALGVQKAREAYELMKEGIIDEFSIGFTILDDEWMEDGWTRKIKKVRLYEWSPVLAGMNPETELVSVKSADGIRKVESLGGNRKRIAEKKGIVLNKKVEQKDEEVIEPVKEEEKKPEVTDEAKTIDYVDVDYKAGEVKIYRKGEAVEVHKMSYKFIKHKKNLSAKSARGIVKPKAEEAKTLFRIKQAARQIDKGAETILRITREGK